MDASSEYIEVHRSDATGASEVQKVRNLNYWPKANELKYYKQFTPKPKPRLLHKAFQS